MGSISEADYLAMQARLNKQWQNISPDLKRWAEAEEEGALQDEIIAYCRHRGWWCDYSRMDKKTTRPLGAPDIIVWADMGRVFACECKRRGGKLRPEQIGVKMLLEGLGHRYLLITSLQQFIVETNK